MRRLLLVSLLCGGCSIAAGSNAGIESLERGPAGAAATGAKYAGWVAGAPLVVAVAPIALASWATPWVDLALVADLATAPSVGLGYALEAIVGLPLLAFRSPSE